MMRNHVIIDCVRSAEWDAPETNQTLSARRNSEGALSVLWNKCSLWWKHQFWHQRHVWLTCGSLANDWIVNEMYPSREGWALDRSRFVITAGAVGEAQSAQRNVLCFSLSNLLRLGALHLPLTTSTSRTQHTPFFFPLRLSVNPIPVFL